MNRKEFIYALEIFGGTLLLGSVVGGITGTLLHNAKNQTVVTYAKAMNTSLPVTNKTSIVFHPDYFLFKIPASGGIREHSERLIAVMEKINSDTELSLLPVYSPRAATFEEIAAIHRKSYIQYIQSAQVLPPSESMINYTHKSNKIPIMASNHKKIPLSNSSITPIIVKTASPTVLPAETPKPFIESPVFSPPEETVKENPGVKEEEEEDTLTEMVTPFYSAALSAGGALMAVDLVMKKQAPNAYALIRPPGHHARPNKYKGFCVFNNVAIAARYAQKTYNIHKILIIDWDVHHGNGTQEMFYDDSSVLYFSIHQAGIYPGTGHIYECGTGKGLGYTINAPMPAHTGMDGYIDVFKYVLEQIVYKFKPELILISAGQDAHYLEKIGASMNMTDEGYIALTSMVKKWADDLCEGRLVAVMEGGYNPKSVSGATAAIIATLAGINISKTPAPSLKNSIGYKFQIKNILNQQRQHWRGLISYQ